MTFSAPLRAYLVDDEPLAVRRLVRLLQPMDRVRIVGKTTNPGVALEFLRAERVDVLFLDIQMPSMNGFELLSRLSDQPMVIFITAYDEYALKAFKVNSVDYLLKPIEPQALEHALEKLERLSGTRNAPELQAQLQSAVQQLAASLRIAPAEFPNRISSRLGSRIQFVELDRITHFAAEEKLTYAVTAGKRYVVDYSIADLVRKLDPRRFVRIHRSTLLNLAAVEEVHSWFAGRLLVRLKGDKAVELTVARDRARILKQALGL